MASDIIKDNYAVTLQDVDGITISGSNYKINSGNKISFEMTNFTMQMPVKVTYRPRTNIEYSSTMNYTTLIGSHTNSGIENIKVSISGIIWADELEKPRNNIGSPIDVKIINDLRVFNHKLYLQDYHGNSTTIASPIWSLCNKTDLLGNTVGVSTGLPVVITNISNVRRGNDTDRGLYITYTIELEEDR